MKLALGLDLYRGATLEVPVELVRHAEALGFHSVWTAEAYGADALSPLAYLAALTTRIKLGTGVVQVAARTPAATAMHALTIDALAGGDRVIIGLGVSGPQIVEGWYGQPWGSPNRRLREYVAVMRTVFAREPLTNEGPDFPLPFTGPGATGQGKPLRSILHPAGRVEVWLAAGGPKNTELCAEVADGMLPMGWGADGPDVYGPALEQGFAARGGRPTSFEIFANASVTVTDDVQACLDAMKPLTAMYVGGMGSATHNFHREAMARRGFPEAAARIHELWLAGRREEAVAAVPDEYLDDGGLYGSEQRIRRALGALDASRPHRRDRPRRRRGRAGSLGRAGGHAGHGGGVSVAGSGHFETILVDRPADRVARITLHRPEKRNAISTPMRAELLAVLEAHDADDEVRVTVIRGAGDCFSAGYDLGGGLMDEPPFHTAPGDGAWARHVTQNWFDLWDLAKPVIAQVHGYAIAGATELAQACDLVYVAEDARIDYPVVRVASPPDFEYHMPLLGLRRAMEIMLTGGAMTGTEAARIGWANRAFPAGDLEDEVLDVASTVAGVASDLAQINKRMVHRQAEIMGVRAAVRAGSEFQALAGHQASVQAFKEDPLGAMKRLNSADAARRAARDARRGAPPA